MAGEKLIEDDPRIGARVVIKAHEGGADVPNAWGVLVDWGFEGDTLRAFDLLASEAGSEEKAKAILAQHGIQL